MASSHVRLLTRVLTVLALLRAGWHYRTSVAGLTRREFEVLRLVAKGLTNAQIAETLVISLTTVNSYLSSVYNKLGVSSRLGAMRYVIDHHLL